MANIEKERSLEGSNRFLGLCLDGYAAQHDRMLKMMDAAGEERDLPIEQRLERLCKRYAELKRG